LLLKPPLTANLLVGAWAITNRPPRRWFTAHSGCAFALAFNADSTRLATAGDDGLVKLWDTRTWQLAHTFPRQSGGVHPLAFNRDGRHLATGGSDGAVRVWDVKDGKQLLVLYGHTDSVYSVAFSGDGRLASAGRDQTVRIWDLRTAFEAAGLRQPGEDNHGK
jgi:WD40 repeat protein